MRLDGKTTTELTDSGGFEFNTMRPQSQCALEYNTTNVLILRLKRLPLTGMS